LYSFGESEMTRALNGQLACAALRLLRIQCGTLRGVEDYAGIRREGLQAPWLAVFSAGRSWEDAS
jgi:hypothetical protein